MCFFRELACCRGMLKVGSLLTAMALPHSGAMAAATQAEFIPLGFLNRDGFGPVIAYGISADGSVVVGEAVSSNFEAFRWTQANGIEGLGTFPNPGGFPSSQARACSADGAVIVGSSMMPNSLNEDGSQCRWPLPNGPLYLGNLGGTTGGVARGVSSDGSVIVGYSSNASFNLEAFRWTSSGMIGLGDLGTGGTFNSQASAVSGDGSLVVGLASASGVYDRSFKWTQATGIQQLGPATFRVIGLSRNGVFAAGGNVGRASRVDVASGTALPIPHVAIPGLNTDTDTAWAANADGSVIVGMMNLSTSNGFFGRAFIWDATHGPRIIQDMLINDFGLGAQLSGWELNAATCISDDSLSIAGYGFAPSGEQAGWLVRLPHPECLGDSNGSHAVDIDDLVNIITHWSQTGSGIAADVNHDNIVNIDDLVLVITHWGACP